MGELKSVEIFSVGTWNGFKFVESDISDIAKNSNELQGTKEHQPPVKLGHSVKQVLDQSDGQPSLGWLHNFKVSGSKLLADIQQVPDILLKAINTGLYKKVSVELDFIKRFGWHVTGLAVLGADVPAVKNLSDLDKFFSDKKSFGSFGELVDYVKSNNLTFDNRLSFSEPIILNTPKEKKMEEAQLRAQIEEEMRKEFKEKQLGEDKKYAVLQAKIIENEAKLEEAAIKERELLFSDSLKSALAPFEAQSKEGKLQPALFEEIKKEMEAQKSTFSGAFTFSLALADKIAKGAQLNQGEFSENQENDEKRVDEIISDKVHELMVKTGKSYSDSVESVFMMNPELEKQYATFAQEISDKGRV